MTWVQVRFWLFVCVWVVVLILVFPRSGEWEIRYGRLSCAAPAVHPVSGVSVVAPLLRVEVAESPAGKPDFAHDVEGDMPARVSLGGHVLENSGTLFCRHLEIYLQRLCVPLELTADMVHPVEGWCVLGMQGNRLRCSPRMARLITMCFQCFLRIRRWCIPVSCGRADYRFSSMKRSCTATRMR